MGAKLRTLPRTLGFPWHRKDLLWVFLSQIRAVGWAEQSPGTAHILSNQSLRITPQGSYNHRILVQSNRDLKTSPGFQTMTVIKLPPGKTWSYSSAFHPAEIPCTAGGGFPADWPAWACICL